jgi:uncharacterized protein (DUF2126 family)
MTGSVEPSEVDLGYDMPVRRIDDGPRVAKPYTDDQRTAIQELAYAVDQDLARGDVRLTIGGRA